MSLLSRVTSPAELRKLPAPELPLLADEIRDFLIDTVTRKFNVNLDEAANPDPRSYATFNQFFTRALKPGARVADADPRSRTTGSSSTRATRATSTSC